LILVADNLREKNIDQLIPGILNAAETSGIPVVGVCTQKDYLIPLKSFFKSGTVDVVNEAINDEELILRLRLRIREARVQNALTPNDFFFSEAQEKEQGKRSGIFNFFDQQKTEVGCVAIQKGRVVKATYGTIIKEDAFLQLACNSLLSFQFEDHTNVEKGTIDASITNLLLEAYKLKDEMKKQDHDRDGKLKALIIDSNRIERLLANRVLKNLEIESKVVGPDEFTLRFMAQFAPDFLILDQKDARSIMDLIWQSGRKEDDIPVIIYCDKRGNDLYSTEFGKHKIDIIVNKKFLHLEIKDILKKLFNFSPEGV